MPKHKSAATIDSSGSSSDSGPDPEPEPAPKKAKKEKKEKKKKQEDDDDEKEHMYALSRQRFCNVREFRGKILIDIREYYEADGEMKPGKKGISLTIEQWRKLESKMDEINESIQALS
ncbi:Activated RNA polymerase II transcriptional coactivator p15 [Holothuria leucospilota]|uniref:Activated RNA polymerase II transcriptional coactivator p15 n=1 Tax=Holothuria leucospilota TaxID=206669 RepID=A0A9Q1BMG6_HOLLE|nr:Activated RNA polymerase II transcriptional coactivator p15 [Holothuria leucospilota]